MNIEMVRPGNKASSPEEETMVLSSENRNERLVVASCQVELYRNEIPRVRQYQSAGCVLPFTTSSCHIVKSCSRGLARFVLGWT